MASTVDTVPPVETRVEPRLARHRRELSQGRAALEMNDEYDLQDIVEVLLRSLYGDVRNEEWTPSSAGSASRIDTFLREGRTALEVKVTRSFKAPKALVYRAYTEPALMRRWLVGYPGWTMPVCDMDVRVGGSYRWRWKNDEDNSEFGFFGVVV